MFLNPPIKSAAAWKETLSSFLIAALCFFLVYFFPADDYLQNLTKNVFFLLVIPFLYVKIVLQKDFYDFGVNWEHKKIGIIWGAGMFLFLTIIFFFIIRYTKFNETYFPPDFVKTSFGYFLFYELVLINLLFLAQEIFFKGFLISALREKLGPWSILIQSCVFLLPLLFSRSYFVEVLPMIALSVLGGLVAYESRSFVFSYLFGLLFLILLDVYIIFINQ